MHDSPLRIINSHEGERRSWHGAAFVVEALVLLVFLTLSLAALVSLVESVHARGTAADELSAAAIIASNDAESFAADPSIVGRTAQYRFSGEGLRELSPDEASSDEPNGKEGSGQTYELVRVVQDDSRPAGTLFEAHITVSRDGRIVYELDTSRYVSTEGATE